MEEDEKDRREEKREGQVRKRKVGRKDNRKREDG